MGAPLFDVILEAEGIHFDETGCIDLNLVRWEFPVC